MNSTNKCILGIDYGTKYIGLAMGRGDIVMPLDTLNYKKNHQIGEEAINKIVKYVKEDNCDLIVIGLPLLKGKETKMSKEVREFAKVLEKKLIENKLNIEIKFVDESGTSKESVKKAIDMNISRKRRKDDHALAACNILKGNVL